MYAQMAWRNLWRNPKRTAVILTAVVIGVWCMIIYSAFNAGMLESMLHNGISTLTGHLKVQAEGYRQDPVVDNSLQYADKTSEILERNLPAGAGHTARINVDAVAQNARHSSGIKLVGMQPDKEAEVSFIGPDVTEGEYLKTDDDRGILIGKALAEDFDTEVGKKIVLMSQDSEGEIASRAFRIRGIFSAEMESVEKGYMFITLRAAQSMLKLKDSVSEFSVMLSDREAVDGVVSTLQSKFPEGVVVSPWYEILPLIRTQIDLFNNFLYLWYFVVFIAMGFGIVNTMLMAVLERIREFGLLKALGMKPRIIMTEVLVESILLLIVGIILGDLLGYLSVLAFADGIDLSSLSQGSEFVGISRIIYPIFLFEHLVKADITVMVLGILVGLYPAVKAARITPVEALAHT